MFSLGGTEIAIILLFAFLIFGPDKMPEIAKTVGRFIRQFRAAQEQMNKVIKEEVYDPIKDLEPLINPFADIFDDITSTGTKLKSSDNSKSKSKDSSKAEPDLQADDVSTATTDGLADSKAEPEAQDGPDEKLTDKPKAEDLKAALDAETKKKRARVVAAAQTSEADDSLSGKESFAERRARLEREHAAHRVTESSAGTDTKSEQED
ncbi:MAG: twin-arginine translocase TatA/TatE family subunit [Coriobacteriales bacterium]|nr:twin-arginine translocase TatA/TatE family subunit [Coriobacteriales bacterium]